MSALATSINKSIGEILGEVSIEALMNPNLLQATKDIQLELQNMGGGND